jgi:hypothetical protein
MGFSEQINYNNKGITIQKGWMKTIIDIYNNCFATNDKGILTIPIPVKKFLNSELTLGVQFYNFPTVLEQTAKEQKMGILGITTTTRRKKNNEKPAGFKIK